VAAYWDQVAFRYRNDDGDEATATWIYSENGDGAIEADLVFRMRFEVENSGADSRSSTLNLYRRLNAGSWTVIGPSTSVVACVDSPYISGFQNSQDRLTTSILAFVAGWVLENAAGRTQTIAASQHTEVEWVLKIIGADVNAGDTIELRVYLPSGVPIEAYTRIPSITVQKTADFLGWFRAMSEPTLPPPPRPHGAMILAAEPSLWPAEEIVTMEKWFRPMSEPTLPFPPRPHGQTVFHPPPALWPPPESITVDKWFSPLSEPLRTIPPRPIGFERLPLEEIVNPDPFLDEWWTELSRPVWPAAALDVLPDLVSNPSVLLERFYADARGLYRVFNAAEYRFFWSAVAPPEEGGAPDATSATLPYTTTATFSGTGTWWFSASFFNGVIDSGFLPLGDAGETYLRLDLAADVEVGNPPRGPNEWRLEAKGAGVVRVWGLYYELGSNRADTWAIAYTLDGSDPPADTPDATQAMPAGGLAVLQYDLPVLAGGTTVKVRLQTYRSSDAVYSENSTIKTLASDAAGPTAPLDAERWPGGLPEEL